MSSGLEALSEPLEVPVPLEFLALMNALEERALIAAPEGDPEEDEEDEDEEGDEDEEEDEEDGDEDDDEEDKE